MIHKGLARTIFIFDSGTDFAQSIMAPSNHGMEMPGQAFPCFVPIFRRL